MIYTVIDIETNGLIRNGKFPEILEVGYLQVNGRQEVVRHGVLYFYKEEWEIENEAQRVHGLQREFLRGYAGEFDRNLIVLWTLMQQSVVVGKNSDLFDLPIIAAFFRRYCPKTVVCRQWRSIDMQKIYTPIYRDWYCKKHGSSTRAYGKLGELMEVIGYSDEQVRNEFIALAGGDRAQKHGALYDAFMTFLLMKNQWAEIFG